MPSTSEDPNLPPPGSGNPLGSAAASEDQVPLALNVIATEAAVSLACFSLLTWSALQLTWASGATSLEQVAPDNPAINFLVYGSAGTVFGVAVLGWILLLPIKSHFRRLGVTMVGTLSGFVLSMIATAVARWLLAAAGLLILLLLSVILGWYFFRRTRIATLALPSQQRS